MSHEDRMPDVLPPAAERLTRKHGYVDHDVNYDAMREAINSIVVSLNPMTHEERKRVLSVALLLFHVDEEICARLGPAEDMSPYARAQPSRWVPPGAK